MNMNLIAPRRQDAKMKDFLGVGVGAASDFIGRLVPGWTGDVLGYALQSWKSVGADAAEDVDGPEGAGVAARVRCDALQFGDGGRGVWAKGSKKVGSHFEVKEGWVVGAPLASRFKGERVREVVSDLSDSLLDWFVVGVGGEPGQEAREGICADGTDRSSGLEGSPVVVKCIGVKHRQLGEGAALIGRFGRWWFWLPQGQEGSCQQCKGKHYHRIPSLHISIVGAAYG